MNVNTISGLVNKKLKFSTVFEFNDFNELHYISSAVDESKLKSALNERVQAGLSTNDICNELIASGKYLNNFIDERLRPWLNSGRLNNNSTPEKCRPPLEEYLAYSSVGIFCISDIDVFKDKVVNPNDDSLKYRGDAAQLMFAHYADNLRGICLVYEAQNGADLMKVEYEQGIKISAGETNRIFRWVREDYARIDMDDFLNKSDYWKYEKEYRIFKQPGFYSYNEAKLELVAILHTPRIGKHHIETLNNINENFYGGQLLIQEIKAALGTYEFVVLSKSNGNRNVLDWLNGKLNSSKES